MSNYVSILSVWISVTQHGCSKIECKRRNPWQTGVRIYENKFIENINWREHVYHKTTRSPTAAEWIWTSVLRQTVSCMFNTTPQKHKNNWTVQPNLETVHGGITTQGPRGHCPSKDFEILYRKAPNYYQAPLISAMHHVKSYICKAICKIYNEEKEEEE